MSPLPPGLQSLLEKEALSAATVNVALLRSLRYGRNTRGAVLHYRARQAQLQARLAHNLGRAEEAQQHLRLSRVLSERAQVASNSPDRYTPYTDALARHAGPHVDARGRQRAGWAAGHDKRTRQRVQDAAVGSEPNSMPTLVRAVTEPAPATQPVNPHPHREPPSVRDPQPAAQPAAQPALSPPGDPQNSELPILRDPAPSPRRHVLTGGQDLGILGSAGYLGYRYGNRRDEESGKTAAAPEQQARTVSVSGPGLAKHSGWAVVPGVQQAINAVGIPALRSRVSPLRDYYEAMARQGVQQGFNPESVPVIMPQWGPSLAAATPGLGMTGTGMVDYLTGRATGMEMRHAWDHAAHKYPALHQATGGVPDLERLLQTIRQNRPQAPSPATDPAATSPASEALPLSRRNRRRLRRSLPGHVQSLLTSTERGGLAAEQMRSPVMRHLIGGLDRGTTHPAVNYMQQHWSSMAPPTTQAGRALGTAAVSGAAQALPGAALHALHDPVGAAAHLAGHALGHVAETAPDAAFMHAAQQGRTQALAATKMRLMSQGAKAVEQPWWRLGNWGRRLVSRVGGALDPAFREFFLAGGDLARTRQRVAESAHTRARASGDPVAQAQAQLLDATTQQQLAKLHQAGSTKALRRGFVEDFPNVTSFLTGNDPRVQRAVAKVRDANAAAWIHHMEQTHPPVPHSVPHSVPHPVVARAAALARAHLVPKMAAAVPEQHPGNWQGQGGSLPDRRPRRRPVIMERALAQDTEVNHARHPASQDHRPTASHSQGQVRLGP